MGNKTPKPINPGMYPSKPLCFTVYQDAFLHQHWFFIPNTGGPYLQARRCGVNSNPHCKVGKKSFYDKVHHSTQPQNPTKPPCSIILTTMFHHVPWFPQVFSHFLPKNIQIFRTATSWPRPFKRLRALCAPPGRSHSTGLPWWHLGFEVSWLFFRIWDSGLYHPFGE